MRKCKGLANSRHSKDDSGVWTWVACTGWNIATKHRDAAFPGSSAPPTPTMGPWTGGLAGWEAGRLACHRLLPLDLDDFQARKQGLPLGAE